LPASDPLRRDAALLIEAVREAGELALSLQRRGVRDWNKNDGSPVSEADLAVDALLRDRLGNARPDYGWLSEESPDDAARLDRRHLWIADPIDGTRAFLAGGGDWCVAVALIRDGQPVAAAIDRPASGEFFSGVAGGGAALNGEPLRLSVNGALQGASVAGPRRALARLEGIGMRAAPEQDIALQLRLALVASGRIDAAVSLGRKNDWDLAAGDLLVREAGGSVSDAAGKGFIYNRREAWQQGLAACNASRHAALVEALNGL
jgi:myo-inositol-1(or 4)-monophosphatase